MKVSGADGIIVPDLPYDSVDGIILRNACEEYSLHLIQVVSPGMDAKRLEEILKISQGFVYCTTQKGTTGNATSSYLTLISFLNELRKKTDLPVAVGFGISSPDDVRILKKHSDIVIIGSAIISEIGADYLLDHAFRFIKNVKEVLDT